jgi:hypothetical protein
MWDKNKPRVLVALTSHQRRGARALVLDCYMRQNQQQPQASTHDTAHELLRLSGSGNHEARLKKLIFISKLELKFQQ